MVHWKRPLKANRLQKKEKKRKKKEKKKAKRKKEREKERGREIKEKYIIVKMYRTYEIRAKGFLFLERSQ